MVEFEVKNYDGQVYLKEELKEILNTPVLRAIGDAKSVVFFAEDVPLERVKRSLKTISNYIDDGILDEKTEQIKNDK